jgi:hypothetical protein
MEPIVGSRTHKCRLNLEWQKPPAGSKVRACAVSADSKERVYCFNRNSEHPVVVFDRDGNFLRSWGAGLFTPRTRSASSARTGVTSSGCATSAT